MYENHFYKNAWEELDRHVEAVLKQKNRKI
jgi:hypothetical protein